MAHACLPPSTEEGLVSPNLKKRVRDSNPGPVGYEPTELPLLQPALSLYKNVVVVSLPKITNT